MEIPTQVVTVLISVITSATITIGLYFLKKKDDGNTRKQKKFDDEKLNLDKQLDDILKIAVTYPYLDSKEFCDSWNIEKCDKTDEKYLRYSVYCNLVFNYMARLAAFCNYDLDCIQKEYLAMTDWVRMHKRFWLEPLNDPNENIDSYSPKFVALINQCLGKH